MDKPPDEDRRRAELDYLTPLVYDELRRVADLYFRRQPRGFTLRPTEIVHEACAHLIEHGNVDFTSSQHFRAIATKKMWQVVVDHLKQRHAQKRGGGGIRKPRSATTLPGAPAATADASASAGRAPRVWQRVPLDRITIEWRDGELDLLDLADAMVELASESKRLSDVVTLHWFGGLTYREVGEYLGISSSTAEKDFRYALAWLNRRLAGTGPHVD